MRGTEAEICATADAIGRELATRMLADGVSSLDGPRGSNIDTVHVTGRGPVASVRLRWLSNGADVSVTHNLTAATALIDAARHLLAEQASIHTRVVAADRMGQDLVRRMRASGVSRLDGSAHSTFTEVFVRADGGLGFTWRSNGTSTALAGNPTAARSLLEDRRHWERQMGAVEGRARRIANGRQTVLDRGRSVLRGLGHDGLG